MVYTNSTTPLSNLASGFSLNVLCPLSPELKRPLSFSVLLFSQTVDFVFLSALLAHFYYNLPENVDLSQRDTDPFLPCGICHGTAAK